MEKEIDLQLGHIISSEKDRYLVCLDTEGADLSTAKTVSCQGRGVFRDKSITPTVGDRVEIRIEGDEGVIVRVLERRNLLFRPPVANIDLVLVVQTIVEPEINPLSLDKLLAVIEKRRLPIIICFNKIDRVGGLILNEWLDRYQSAGYPVFHINALTGEGIDRLMDELRGKITAIAGPSGAGKSTLIRRLSGDSGVEVGELSQKTARGKQTTRRIRLFDIGQASYIFDTPGFSSLDLRDFNAGTDLVSCFPDIQKYARDCRFRNCSHRKEPGCRVRESVERGEIDPLRYKNYLTLFEEVEANRPY